MNIKVHITKRLVVIAAVSFFGLAVLFVTSLWGFLHYRNAYLATEDVRIEAANYKRESSKVFAKIALLEDIIGRTSRLVAKVGSIVETRGVVQSGNGPIGEGSWLSSTEIDKNSFKRTKESWESLLAESTNADLDFELDKLTKIASGLEGKVNSAFVIQKKGPLVWGSVPSTWPVRGWVSSQFGARRSFVGSRSGGRYRRWHEGIDIAAPRGTPIVAPADGMVTYVGYRKGYGKTIGITHGNGISTLYAHCSRIYVLEGDSVFRDMPIAAVGNTGRSTGPHLHYEVHVDGVPVDPITYIVSSEL